MYYVVTNKRVKDNRGKYYAEISESDESFSYLKLSENKNLLFECPRCGFSFHIKDNIGLYTVEFDSENIADFTIGCTNIRYQFVVNEKTLHIFKSFKGIKSFKKADVVMVRGRIIDGKNLYLLEIERSTAILSREKSKLSNPINTYRKDCRVCNPDGKQYMTFNGLSLEGKVDDFDFFTLYENSSLLFISQKVLEKSKNLEISNLIDRCVPSTEFDYDMLKID